MNNGIVIMIQAINHAKFQIGVFSDHEVLLIS